jgi:hypothetical protein
MSSGITFPLTGHWQITKPIQYVAEGITPATFGVTPTAAPQFLLAGAITDITEGININSTMYRTLGTRSYYKALSYGHAYTFELAFSPDNHTLLKYGSEEDNGVGTIGESLTFLKAMKMNAAGSLVEHFIFYKGCRMNVLDISIAGQMVAVNSSWLCRQITTPATSSGLTTPGFKIKSDLTGRPWTHLENGTNPLTINAVTYPCTQFHINWNNNIAVDQVNGQDLVDQLTQGNRDITGDFTVVVGNTVLEADLNVNPMPARSGTYVLNSTATTSTITLTNLSVTQTSPALKAGDSNTYKIQYNFSAENAVIA